uniref:Uncharacterized protein n=1 Tax=Oryza brachyantha TaxID=4533 RepID=J3M5E0_ORYBR
MRGENRKICKEKSMNAKTCSLDGGPEATRTDAIIDAFKEILLVIFGLFSAPGGLLSTNRRHTASALMESKLMDLVHVETTRATMQRYWDMETKLIVTFRRPKCCQQPRITGWLNLAMLFTPILQCEKRNNL